MTLQVEKVGHKALMDGGETSLHSHPGGGSGVVVKSGAITTDANGIGAVIFGTAFSDAGYAISLTAQDPGDGTICMYSNKAANGFDVSTLDDSGKVEKNVVVDWLATPYSNP